MHIDFPQLVLLKISFPLFVSASLYHLYPIIWNYLVVNFLWTLLSSFVFYLLNHFTLVILFHSVATLQTCKASANAIINFHHLVTTFTTISQLFLKFIHIILYHILLTFILLSLPNFSEHIVWDNLHCIHLPFHFFYIGPILIITYTTISF